MRQANGKGRFTFIEDVKRVLGEGALAGTFRKVSLRISGTPIAQVLQRAKALVENCASRPRKLDNACVAICNIAALLDAANVEHPRRAEDDLETVLRVDVGVDAMETELLTNAPDYREDAEKEKHFWEAKLHQMQEELEAAQFREEMLKADIQSVRELLDLEKCNRGEVVQQVQGLRKEVAQLRSENAVLKDQVRHANDNEENLGYQQGDKEVLNAFLCPISKEVMKDPHIMIHNKTTFDKCSIESWFKAHNQCPISGRRLNKEDRQLVPNIALRSAIEEHQIIDLR